MDFSFLTDPRYNVLGAFWMTIQLTFWSAIGSFVLGVILVAMRVSPVPLMRGFAGTVVPAVWAAFGVNAGPPDEVAVVPRDDVDVGAEFAFPVEFGRHPVEPDAPGVLGAPGA